MRLPSRTSQRAGTRARRSAGRPALLGALALSLAVPGLALAQPAQALDPARVGPGNPGNHGYPVYYTDDSGVALQMCDDGTAACLGAGPDALTPPEGENFYFMATTSLSAPGLDLDIEIAAEAAWLSPTVPITFDRLRIRGHSESAGDIVVTTPYGATTVTADDPAQQRNVNFTEDVGCAGAPCNFADTASSANAHITSWITSTTPPPGRIGDGVTSEPATVGAGGPAAVASAGGATTSNWVVMGKLADPFAVSMPRTLDIGNVKAARTRTLRMRNLGTQPMTVSSTTLSGSRSITALRRSTCTDGRVVNVGRSCSVVLRYRPGTRKQAAATLRIDDSAPGVRSVRVTARTAAELSTRRTQGFPAASGGSSGATRRIVVTNTGSLPLRLRRISLTGRDARSFEIRSGAPRVCRPRMSVRPRQQCAVYVGFAPRGFGPKRAALVIRGNGLPATQTVALSGRAR
jgi:hypothetical protein